MRRVRFTSPHQLRVSGDRWLFGYADIVTLLFACFASLYATTLLPAEVEAARDARAADIALPAPAPRLEALVGSDFTLPGVETTTSVRGVVISLPEAGSFSPGRAELSEGVKAAMRQLAERLRPLPNQIRVEGHTDDVPISTPAFRSNWELSTARATRVLEWLVEDGGLSPTRLSAAGYGEFRPRLPNASAAARARNRRVDIVVLDPGVATREEPEASAR